MLTVDANGVRFAGRKDHAWTWKYRRIQELKLGPARSVVIRTYQDRKLRLGADRHLRVHGEIPAEAVIRLY